MCDTSFNPQNTTTRVKIPVLQVMKGDSNEVLCLRTQSWWEINKELHTRFSLRAQVGMSGSKAHDFALFWEILPSSITDLLGLECAALKWKSPFEFWPSFDHLRCGFGKITYSTSISRSEKWNNKAYLTWGFMQLRHQRRPQH